MNVDNVPNVPDRYKSDKNKPTPLENGYFRAPNGKKYKFDEDGNLVDENGNIVPQDEAEEILKGVNCDDIPNAPNQFRANKIPEAPMVKRDGTFMGADGKNYRFDKNGNLIDEDGNIVPEDKIPGILDGILCDSIPNCPDKYKSRKVPPVDSDGFWKGSDGKKYKYTPNGQLVDSNGNEVPRD